MPFCILIMNCGCMIVCLCVWAFSMTNLLLFVCLFAIALGLSVIACLVEHFNGDRVIIYD